MSKNKDPAVQFYTADFLVGVQDLTMEERGQYITLLCLQHQQGHLSEKLIKLSLGAVSQDVIAKFKTDENGLYYHHRMEEEIAKREAYIERQHNNGSKGGRPKNQNHNPNESQTKPKLNPRVNPNHNPNESTRVDNDNVIKDVIEYLNIKIGTKYKYNSDYINKHINARLSEGFALEDFKTVIDKKYLEWNGTEMAKFLRPETLFGTKFQAYLNELPSAEAKKTVHYGGFDPDEAFRIALERSQGGL